MRSGDGGARPVAIVTGGAGGLGSAICRRLAAAGMNILLTHRARPNDAERVAAACIAESVDAVHVEVDIDSDADCRRAVAAALDRWGAIDFLVNCAGRTKMVPHADLEGLDAADFEAIFRTNVVGAFQMIRACEPAMRRRGDAAIVNISSLAALDGSGSSVAYAASKAALNSLTRSLARALAPQIRVNSLCPGFMATPWFSDRMDAAAFNELERSQAARAPLERTGSPAEIAEAVAFLLGSGGRNMTGTLLLSDAGLHLGAREGAHTTSAGSRPPPAG